MIEKILESLNLDEFEQKTYLFLLKNGSSKASQIAKKIGINRSSLYGILKRLIEHELILEIELDGTKNFSAEPPEKIETLLQRKIENLNQNTILFRKILPDLKSKQKKGLTTPKISMVEGEKGMQTVMKDMVMHYDLRTFALWPIAKMLNSLSPEFFSYLNKERIKNNIYTRALWPASQVVDFKKHPYLGVGEEFKREIRVLPKGIEFEMGYWSYANKVAFISSQRENFGFLVESEELVNTLKFQFDLLWKISSVVGHGTPSSQT